MPNPSSPTGRELAVAFARKFPGEDWIARLSERSGMDRDTVEWHLQEDMAPPDAVMKAASEMEGEPAKRDAAGQYAASRRTSPNPGGLVSANPVVLSGDGDATTENGHGRDCEQKGAKAG